MLLTATVRTKQTPANLLLQWADQAELPPALPRNPGGNSYIAYFLQSLLSLTFAYKRGNSNMQAGLSAGTILIL
jgi:hypothetical protein